MIKSYMNLPRNHLAPEKKKSVWMISHKDYEIVILFKILFLGLSNMYIHGKKEKLISNSQLV